MFALLMLCGLCCQEPQYYCIVFSSQNPKLNTPDQSHVWATFVTATGGKIQESFTISWYPQNPWRITDRRVPGYNKTLHASIADILNDGNEVVAWGPYAMTDKAYRNAQLQYRRLEGGYCKYKAIDFASRDKDACNCIHAVSDIGYRLHTGTRYGHAAAGYVITCLQRQELISRQESHDQLLTDLGLDRYKWRRKATPRQGCPYA